MTGILLSVDSFLIIYSHGIMYTRMTITGLVFTAAVILAASCGKSKPDASKYAEACSRIMQCDQEFQKIPGGQTHCQNFFVQLEQKFPDTVAPMTECVKTTACEELSFQKCGEKHLQQLKGLLP